MDKFLPEQKFTKYNGDSAAYFQNVLYDAWQNEWISVQQAAKIRTQLLEILKNQTKRYTMGDSDSIPVELAQELLDSIYYAIGLALAKTENQRPPVESMLQQSMESLFQSGQHMIQEKVLQAKEYLTEVQKNCIEVDNLSYRDTIFQALPLFFKQYDSRFLAHQMPCDIDYQLCLPVRDKRGIDFILEYLRRLRAENCFCSRFSAGQIILLLDGYCPDYREQLINLFEPVFYNAMGLTLLAMDVKRLTISESEKGLLFKRSQKLSVPELDKMVRQALKALYAQLSIEDAMAKSYLYAVSKQFLIRLNQQLKTGDFGGFFTSFPDNNEPEACIQYRDGEQMSNEKLRQIIKEMQSCRFLSDKLLMVKQTVHALGDLVEILKECFWGDEYAQVFAIMQDMELAALWRYICDQKGDDLYCIQYNADWENQLLEYLNSLERTRREKIHSIADKISLR